MVKFSPGQVVATVGALEMEIDLLPYLLRHLSGDWGEMDSEDRAANEWALGQGGRLFSAYDTPAGRLWVITEADHSATTFLLPDEY